MNPNDSFGPHVPQDGAATTDIITPAIRRARPNTVHVEWCCLELALDLAIRIGRAEHIDAIDDEHGSAVNTRWAELSQRSMNTRQTL